MAYETKVILASLAEAAAMFKCRKMYNHIRKIANVEGEIIEPYEAAAARQAEDDDDKRSVKNED